MGVIKTYQKCRNPCDPQQFVPGTETVKMPDFGSIHPPELAEHPLKVKYSSPPNHKKNFVIESAA